MASSADAIIGTLLQGTGFGRTVADSQQQNLQIQQGQQGLQLGQLQIDAYHQQQAQAAQEKAAYDQWEAGFFKDPTANNLMTGITRFPKQYQALVSGWNIKDEAAKTADLGYFTQLHSALDAGRSDLAQTLLQQRIDAEKKAGKDTTVDDSYLDALKSGDTSAINALKGVALGGIAVGTGPDKFASTYKAVGGDPDANHYGQFGSGGIFDQRTGHVMREPSEKPDYKIVKNADGTESVVQVGGGDPASSGAAAGGGDTSRLINSDAGGGYVPDSVKTLGQFVTYGRSMNARGAKSSSAGTYQINGSTMAEFAPKALGPDWKSQPFNADAQEKVGESIFNWAKQQPDPSKALQGRWVSLNKQQAAQLVQGDWSQARGVIAQGETGGGAGASAARAMPSGGPKVVFTSTPGTANPVDQATVDFYAQKVAAGGDLPQLGMGKEAAAWRQAILKRSAQIQTGNGMTGGDSNLQHADVKSAQMALTALQKTRNSLDPYLKTFDGNVDQVRKLAPAGVGGNVPVFNRWVQAGRKSISGDPAVAKFDVAIAAVAAENAKIMSGASGGAVTSDSARHEAQQLINNAQTLPQLMAALNQMQTDTRIRLKAMDDKQAQLRGTISGRQQPAPAHANPQRSALMQKYGLR